MTHVAEAETLTIYYRADFAKKLRRSLRTFDRMRSTSTIPAPDGKDITRHDYWLPETVEATYRKFFGMVAA